MSQLTIRSPGVQATPLVPHAAPVEHTGNSKRAQAMENARRSTQGLIDFGPLAPLITALSAAIDGKGPAWPELSQSLLKLPPKDLQALKLAFTDAFRKAEDAARVGDRTAYPKALKMIRTTLTMSVVLG